MTVVTLKNGDGRTALLISDTRGAGRRARSRRATATLAAGGFHQ